MKTGRKSAAELSVVPCGPDKRPQAPEHLTEVQQNLWTQIVRSEAEDAFDTPVLQELLADYCRHTDAANHFTKKIDSHLNNLDTKISLRDLDLMLKMRDRESKAAGERATKLRLTNQSRYNPRTAATKMNNQSKGTKPWHQEN